MLKLLIGKDWVANSNSVLELIAQDVRCERDGRILIVPELISHDTERRLCAVAGNTSSRFAEVLTFTRLARRVSEDLCHGLLPCMDEGGRVVAMASAARQLHSRLKAYAAVETKPEFLRGLVDAVDEFKRCCITPADLMAASKSSAGAFAQKLEELSLLMEAYDGLCLQGKRDPRDQMTWLLEQLEDSDFACRHTFYIDGFPDFTRQHLSIVAHLLEHSQNVTISINCDRLDTDDVAFEKAAETAKEILLLAKKAGIAYSVETFAARDAATGRIATSLFQGKITPLEMSQDCLRVYQTDSIHAECQAAAEQILDLIQNGARYRDICVVCTDIGSYRHTLSLVLNECGIPFYTSGTDDILEKSVVNTVLSALDVVCGGFEQGDVLRYLKSPLSVLDIPTCDKLENYALLWSISGKNWFKQWQNHPDGLVDIWTNADHARLRYLNEAKDRVLNPLYELEKAFKDARTLGELVTALYAFLEEIHLAERLEILAKVMDAGGDNRNAQILVQLWDILLGALEQLYDVLGNTAWDTETFTRLLRLLLSQYSVGTIPTVLDSVIVGPVSAMRCQRTEYLFVLGATEGLFPGYGGISGVLTDQERTELRQMGIPLTGGALDGLKTEYSEIYGVFCGAQKFVCVSCADGQPSYLYRRLCQMAGGEKPVTELTGAARVDPGAASGLLLRNKCADFAADLNITHDCQELEQKTNYNLGELEEDTVTDLYGRKLRLSASQVDKLADCRLAYFLKYGLRARERKAVEVDPAEFGTFVHAVLEKTAGEVLELGGFRTVSKEDTLNIAAHHAQEYAAQRFATIDSSRSAYLFQRNLQELEMVTGELWEELQQSQFQPVEFEVGFGSDCDMPPVQITGGKLQAELRGFVDRVDAWRESGCNYFRVVDYKTGKKDFDYCDVFNGSGLQMLLYMFALARAGECILGENPVPAGVQYFPARAPVVTADGVLTDEDAEEARRKLWKRKGLLLQDEDVLTAMEPGDKPIRLSYTRRKDGSISGDLADRDQLKLLEAYIYHLLEEMVDEIASGDVQPNPYTRGSAHNACMFCPYGQICHPEYVEGRRDYKAMTAQRFWDEIEKEMKKFG